MKPFLALFVSSSSSPQRRKFQSNDYDDYDRLIMVGETANRPSDAQLLFLCRLYHPISRNKIFLPMYYALFFLGTSKQDIRQFITNTTKFDLNPKEKILFGTCVKTPK